jgi:hypothetical protein
MKITVSAHSSPVISAGEEWADLLGWMGMGMIVHSCILPIYERRYKSDN